MSEEETKDLYSNANEIINSIKNYPNTQIASGLADIHKRVENVIKYKQIDKEKDKQNPVFYQVKNLTQMHSSTSDDYYNFTLKEDLGDKVKIIGNISAMNNILIDLEQEEDYGEEV